MSENEKDQTVLDMQKHLAYKIIRENYGLKAWLTAKYHRNPVKYLESQGWVWKELPIMGHVWKHVLYHTVSALFDSLQEIADELEGK